MQAVYPVVPLNQNQALGVALFSYNDGLFWGFNADWDVVPDLHDLVGAVERELSDLHRAALQEPEVEAPTAASRRTRRARAARKPPARSRLVRRARRG
jgi:hypothetical protein